MTESEGVELSWPAASIMLRGGLDKFRIASFELFIDLPLVAMLPVGSGGY